MIRTLVLLRARRAGLLFLFDWTVTITVGILMLFAAIVCGVFAIASPECLTGEREDAG